MDYISTGFGVDSSDHYPIRHNSHTNRHQTQPQALPMPAAIASVGND